MAKKYLSGADAKFIGALETTPGTFPAAGNYRYLDFMSTTLGADNPFSDRDILGRGRNPGDPILASNETVNGNIVIPASARGMGLWLTGLFGAAAVTTVKAKGYFEFGGQPANNSTLTFNGFVWTAVTSGATGAQTNIGVDLDATLTALALDLNTNTVANAEIGKCTFTANTTLNRLEVEFDTAGVTGNTYTLAASATSGATRSAATLLGGGYQHKFLSGGDSLPTLALQVGFPGAETPYYKRYSKCYMNTLEMQIQQEGTPDITLATMAGEETYSTVSLDSDPDVIADEYFIQRDAYILVDGTEIGGLMGGTLNFSNNMEPLYLVGGSRMEEATPTKVSCQGESTVRLSSTATLRTLAKERTAVVQTYGWETASKWKFECRMPRAFFNLPREEIGGPGGIDTSYTWRTGSDTGGDGAAVEVYLVNDIAEYV